MSQLAATLPTPSGQVDDVQYDPTGRYQKVGLFFDSFFHCVNIFFV